MQLNTAKIVQPEEVARASPSPLVPDISCSPAQVSQSFAWCARLSRRQAANFYHAFLLLPKPQRQAMCALYAFMRVTDDIADGPGSTDAKRGPLETWRQELGDALGGTYHHPLHPALHDTVVRFAIPRRYLDAVLDGVAMDLDTNRYETFDDLYRYCWRVASVVGMCCTRIWGAPPEAAEPFAESAGIAFQLTNILRDIAEDATRGRVYLPQEDLRRFGYGEEDIRAGRCDDRFRALMRLQATRAYEYYDAGKSLEPLLPAPGRAVFQTMARTYRGLLDEIVRRDFDVFSGRIRLSRWRKFWLAARALPVRYGLMR